MRDKVLIKKIMEIIYVYFNERKTMEQKYRKNVVLMYLRYTCIFENIKVI
jgi:hypothetical protein